VCAECIDAAFCCGVRAKGDLPAVVRIPFALDKTHFLEAAHDHRDRRHREPAFFRELADGDGLFRSDEAQAFEFGRVQSHPPGDALMEQQHPRREEMHGVRAAIPRTSPLASAEFAMIRESTRPAPIRPMSRGAVCPDEPPTKADQPQRVAQRVASHRSSRSDRKYALARQTGKMRHDAGIAPSQILVGLPPIEASHRSLPQQTFQAALPEKQFVEDVQVQTGDQETEGRHADSNQYLGGRLLVVDDLGEQAQAGQ
jgi:hypothetical protein